MILYSLLEDGDPILKPGLAICDPCGPKVKLPMRQGVGSWAKISSCHPLSSLSVFILTRHSSAFSPSGLCYGSATVVDKEKTRNRDIESDQVRYDRQWIRRLLKISMFRPCWLCCWRSQPPQRSTGPPYISAARLQFHLYCIRLSSCFNVKDLTSAGFRYPPLFNWRFQLFGCWVCRLNHTMQRSPCSTAAQQK